MKKISIEQFLGLINDGFEGEARFSGSVFLAGDCMRRATYVGELALRELVKTTINSREYAMSSHDSRFTLCFKMQKTARLEHPSESANVIKIPILLPENYHVEIDNPEGILY